MDEKRVAMQENLEEFEKKFWLFFIGLCGFALSVVVNAFGSVGWGSACMLIMAATWCAPLVVKYWFSGWGALFDFQLVRYEIYNDGTKRDVTTFGETMIGPFMKCMVALLVALAATVIVPMEMIVRLINHIRFEQVLGDEKGKMNEAPRKQALMCGAVLLAMIVLGTTGTIVSNIRENTSDIGKDEVVELIEALEEKSKSYTINAYYNYHSESNRTLAKVTVVGDTVTFDAYDELSWTHRIDSGNYDQYTLPRGTYTYKNGAWVDVDEQLVISLNKFTLHLAFDFEAMKQDPKGIVVNCQKGQGGRVDQEQHDYYEVIPKKNSKKFTFDHLYIDEDFDYVEWQEKIYIFD